MRRHVVGFFLCWAFAAHAADTLRVGSAVLVVGDPVARVKALLGEPTHKGAAAHAISSKTRSAEAAAAKSGPHKAHKTRASSKAKQNKAPGNKAASKGETWQYRRGGHTTLITIADGRVAAIEDIPR